MTMSINATGTTLARSQRVLPSLLAQANRAVPVSISRATSGAPKNRPASTGISGRASLSAVPVVL